jgi:hypothetical protein
VPQKRWPLAWTAHATAPPITLSIAACADAGTNKPAAIAAETSILRISPPPP